MIDLAFRDHRVDAPGSIPACKPSKDSAQETHSGGTATGFKWCGSNL